MIAAGQPIQRAPHAKLLVVDADGKLQHVLRSALVGFLRPGDVVVANDAATLPASLHGVHVRSGSEVEVRLAGRHSLASDDVVRFTAIVFGAGDFHTRTEDRPLPPNLAVGDRLVLGPLHASVEKVLSHPRLVALRFDGAPDAIWAGLARHGKPIQYAHLKAPLALWDVWTSIAGSPVAFEPPSAGFALDWQIVAALRSRGIAFATLTHAAGISSTGDAELDKRLPFDEPYDIPPITAAAIAQARERGGRVVAVGTTVVRALEHAPKPDGTVHAGAGVATQRIDATTRLRVVDAILSGTHEPGSSHYELLRAFADDVTLRRANDALETHHYKTHEFGDSVLVERARSHDVAVRATRRRSFIAPGQAIANNHGERREKRLEFCG
jgi:S-adenosylmethionine:tRNA ribosyltransferase-isomerase